jgi:predicted TIM-barrel fold metal-dependent hydrolase
VTDRVDAHVHLYRRLSPGYPRAILDVFPEDSELVAETFLGLMDRAGVARAVVVALDHESRYLLDCLAAHPDRFWGIGVVDPADPDPAATFMRLASGGVRGMRTGILGDADHADLHPRPRALLEALRDADGVLWFYGASDQIPALRTTLADFPDVPIVLNHLAFFPGGFGVDADGNRTIETELPPRTLRAVADLAREHAGLHVVLSGQYAFSRRPFPHEDLAETTRAVVAAFGADRCLWGTDHPASSPSASYEEIATLPARHLPDLAPTDLAAIMGGTADRLFGGPDR